MAGPDFIYIGCQKAGSRWLYDQLNDHPAFWMPPIKELHYFDSFETGRPVALLLRKAKKRIELVEKGQGKANDRKAVEFLYEIAQANPDRIDLDWYASLFEVKDRSISGDITPAYCTLSSSLIETIITRFSGLKLILFVRDPVDRAWSQACQDMRKGAVDPLTDPTDWAQLDRYLQSDPVIARSYPSRVYEHWFRHVPKERLFVGFFDQLREQPDVLRSDVLRFLGADPSMSKGEFRADFNRKSETERVTRPDEITRQLANHFRTELQACAKTFGGPAAKWPGCYGFDCEPDNAR